MDNEVFERYVRALLQPIRYWVRFIGVRRLVAGTAGALCFIVGAWFVLRPTPTSVDVVLPHATTVSVSITTGSQVVVHVTGAVKRPGVYTISASSRIIDALNAAGGALASADLERINLAQTVSDAEQIHVPHRWSRAPRATVAPRLRPRPRQVPSVSAPAEQKLVNINTATATQLETLTGVGPSLAKSIITYRSQKGPFAKVDDLLNVPGIGPSKLAAMRSQVTVT